MHGEVLLYVKLFIFSVYSIIILTNYVRYFCRVRNLHLSQGRAGGGGVGGDGPYRVDGLWSVGHAR